MEEILIKIMEVLSISVVLVFFICVFMIFKTHNDSAIKFHRTIIKQIQEYYHCDEKTIDLIWEFRDSRFEWRQITLLKDNEPYGSSILIDFDKLKILKYQELRDL